jgi:Ca2+-binding EF-hand superfamily protein
LVDCKECFIAFFRVKFQQIKIILQFFKSTAALIKLKKIAVAYIASQLPEKQIHKLGNIFKQIDENNDGYLTVDELNKAL